MVFSDWLPVIGWTIPAVGWYVANKQANERELRKEVRSEIEEVVELVGDILDSLKKYLAQDGGAEESVELHLEIVHLFKRLDTLLDVLDTRQRSGLDDFSPVKLLELQDVKDLSTRFFDACTGDDFGEPDRVKLTGRELASAWLRCSNIGHELLNKLHRQFIARFSS